jgi:hypothetical protein
VGVVRVPGRRRRLLTPARHNPVFVCPPEGGLGSSWLKHASKHNPVFGFEFLSSDIQLRRDCQYKPIFFFFFAPPAGARSRQ